MMKRPLPKRFLKILLASAALLVSASVIAQSADELAKAAREAARSDRNRQSAELFESALAAAPDRRREWLREYADQLTYSGRAAQATRLYREYLAGPAEPGDRRRGRQGLALALSWSDQPSEARLVYEELLVEDPRNIDTQRSLARVISWSGHQREAQTYLRNFLGQHPDDAEGRLLLAQAQWWIGRPDSARDTLTSRRDDAGVKLLRDIDRALAQETRFDQQRSSQSDNLDITTESIEHRWTSANGLTMVAPWLQRIRYAPRGDSPGVTDQRTGARGRHRFSDDFEINADIAADRIEPGAYPSYTRLTYSSWITWWSSDEFRFDLSTNRSTFDNVRSLQRDITARSDGVSLDWTANERDRLAIRISRADYSDGNRRDFAQIEAERRLHTHPTLWGGLRCTHFDFSQQLDNGYFNPLNFNTCLATLRAEGGSSEADARWSWNSQLAAGREYARPDGVKPAYEMAVAAAYRLARGTRLEARLQRFSSKTGSASGFARSTAGITLVHNWNAD